MTELALAPVAGIPIVHHFEPALSTAAHGANRALVWLDSGGTEVPVHVYHALGDVSTDGLAPALDAPPWLTYFVDVRGEAVVRFHDVVPELPPHILRTVRPGYEYEVRYAEVPATAPLRGVELAVYPQVLAARERGVIVHSCSWIQPEGGGVVAAGVSGAGKTTLARLVAAVEGTTVLTDDRAILTLERDGLRLWGSPWPGDAGIALPACTPLAAIVFLRHGTETAIREVSEGIALGRLLTTVALPVWNPDRLQGPLAFVERILLTTPIFEVTYPPTVAAAQWIVTTLAEGVRNG